MGFYNAEWRTDWDLQKSLLTGTTSATILLLFKKKRQTGRGLYYWQESFLSSAKAFLQTPQCRDVPILTDSHISQTPSGTVSSSYPLYAKNCFSLSTSQ